MLPINNFNGCVRLIPRCIRLLLAFAVIGVFLPGEAMAHVKWFCGAINVTAPPRSVSEVMATLWFSGGVAFVLLIFIGSAIDTMAAQRWKISLASTLRSEIGEEFLIRIGFAAYVLCLWNNTAMVPWGAGARGAILTADLLHQDVWIGRFQVLIAILLAFRRTLPLAGLGLVILYGLGVARYGMFYMLDYVFFLGAAGYLVLSAPRLNHRPDIRVWRVPFMTACLSFSLMWTAIEKFLFPEWTTIVLVLHPALAFGFPVPFVIGVAGFVEFALAFYLLIGRSLLRLDALLLMVVFVSAIPEFGGLDLIGHLPLVTILIVIMMRGETPLQRALYPPGVGRFRMAGASTVLAIATFFTLMTMYYGFQAMAAGV